MNIDFLSAKNQIRPDEALTMFDWDDVIDYEIETPLGYWKPGVPIVPSEVKGRVRQLQTFDELFQGDWRSGVKDQLSSNDRCVYCAFVDGLPASDC